MAFENVKMDSVSEAFNLWKERDAEAREARKMLDDLASHNRKCAMGRDVPPWMVPIIRVRIEFANREGAPWTSSGLKPGSLAKRIEETLNRAGVDNLTALVAEMEAEAEEARQAFLRSTLAAIAGDEPAQQDKAPAP